MTSNASMPTIFAAAALLAAQLLSAQTSGYAEYADQRGYHNSYVDVMAGEDHWILGANQKFSSFSSTASVSAFGMDGNLLWDTQLPYTGEVTEVYRVMRRDNGGIAAVGMIQDCCDCTIPLSALFFLNSDGEVEEFFQYTQSPLGHAAQTEWGYVLDVDYSMVIGISLEGDSLWTIPVDVPAIFLKETAELVWIFTQNGVDTLNAEGALGTAFTYPITPIDAVYYDGLWVLLYANDVVIYDQDFNFVESYGHGLANPLQIIANDEGFFAHSAEGLFRLGSGLSSFESFELEGIDAFEAHAIAYANEKLIRVGDRMSLPFDIYNYRVRYAAWQVVELNNEPPIHYPDIAVLDVDVEAIAYNEQSPFMHYQIQAMVTVQNTGDVPVEGFFLNFYQDWGICNPVFYSIEYTESLPANATVIVPFGPASGSALYSPPTGVANICVFSTAPGSYIDRNLSNDTFCKALEFTVSVENQIHDPGITVYPNPARDHLRISGADGMAGYRIYNVHGKLTLQGQADLSRDIDVSSLASGIYVLEVSHVSGRGTVKFAID